MSQPVISVENLSKAYRIGLKDEVPDTLVGAMTNIARSPFKNFKRLRSLDTFRDVKSGHGDSDDILWALKDVSFDVQEGEVVGIIGRNGAGKSTLLKILSRITEPTSGRIKIRGRVSSLLEVGTGFHPELTGRENIYMNGTILGMTKREIDSKFDEIVDFSGVEKFLDTPVKRYSSGMSVRLAFAVAAHLEPEILIIDEVLAVGDAEFQKKCLGKMKDVAGQGRTVLFVSHNLTATRQLCPRCIYLDNGLVTLDGETPKVLTVYLHGNIDSNKQTCNMDLTDWANRYGTGEAKILNARLYNHDNMLSSSLQRMKPMSIEFDFESLCEVELNLSIISSTSSEGIKVLQLAHQDTKGCTPGVVNGSRTVRVEVGELPLQCGSYNLTLAIHTTSLKPVDVVKDVLDFCVEDDLTTSLRPYKSICENGLCSLPADWSLT